MLQPQRQDYDYTVMGEVIRQSLDSLKMQHV